MTPQVCGLLLLLLLLLLPPPLEAGPALSRPLETSEPHPVPGAHPKGPTSTKPEALDVLWEKSRNEHSWNSGIPWAPVNEVPGRPADIPLGPALHGPQAAPQAQRAGLSAVTDSLQAAPGPSSQGWTGPPDPPESPEPEARAPYAMGPPHLTFMPTTPSQQLEEVKVPPSTGEPRTQAGKPAPGDGSLMDEAKIRAPETDHLDRQGSSHTLGPQWGVVRPVLTGEWGEGEGFQEAAGGPLSTQQDPAAPDGGSVSPLEGPSSEGPGAQSDLALARSLPPAEELPVEPPKKAGAENTRQPSFPASPLKASPGPQPSGPPASEAPDGQPKREIVVMNGADPVSPQRVRGAVETPGTLKYPMSGPLEPGTATNRTENTVEALQPEEAEEWPGRPQSHPPAPPVQAPSTSRRGLVRVTTQRALAQPLPPDPSASSSWAPAPAANPPANATSPPLRWGPLRRVLSFAWELHVYGAGALFLLPAGLSCAWGATVTLGTLCLCRRRLLDGPRGWDASPGPRLLAVAGALGLLASGLQLAASLWLYPGPDRVGRFSWAWWGVHFWLRLLELSWALALALGAVTAARPRPPTEHACWAKLLRLACPAPAGKSEVPERPNNCYAGPSGVGAGSLDISKSLIRNAAEGRLPATPSSGAWGSAASLGRGAQAGPGLSRSSMGPAPSLSELDLRPPSPINLSRSIDAALFREHLVQGSVFRRCGLRGLLSPPPGGALRLRRGSHPDAELDVASSLLRSRCRSLSDMRVRGPLPPHVLEEAGPAAGTASGSSLDSFSRGSLKISWNPWRHGLSSVDSLPLDELPSTVQLLPAPSSSSTPTPAGPVQPQGERPQGCRPGDSRSASSDTIEL
ncbi:proline-rich transmembrane protein 3 [Echinops telfairi]|uniref:Proline-rich transmembrane protein 3 n=1 Tax=Echinops telfairi TaxID=9371 RepID=A0AC55D218_ECHTE|nr:proline-rich transmembrane protein 3 [Echinops telfairi]